MENESLCEEVRQMYDSADESLINLILSGNDKINPKPENIHCPICTNDTIEIVETSEKDSERVFFQCKCLTCGREFVLLEDLTESCWRGIENARSEIEYNQNKINYFNSKLKGE